MTFCVDCYELPELAHVGGQALEAELRVARLSASLLSSLPRPSKLSLAITSSGSLGIASGNTLRSLQGQSHSRAVNMSGTASTVTAAQKAERRRRFFAALSPETKEFQEPNESKSLHTTEVETSQHEQSTKSDTASNPTTSAPSSFLSSTATDQLMTWQNKMIVAMGVTAPLGSDEARAALRHLYTDSGAQLSPEVAHIRSGVISLQAALSELCDRPDAEIPPELHEMKYGLKAVSFASRAKDAFSPQQVERRVNEALKAEGEGEVKLPDAYEWDTSKDPPLPVRRYTMEEVAEARHALDTRVKDLAQRKPGLHANIMSILSEYMEHSLEPGHASDPTQ